MPPEPPAALAKTYTCGALSRGDSPVWSDDCVQRLGVRGDLQLAPQPGHEPQVVSQNASRPSAREPPACRLRGIE